MDNNQVNIRKNTSVVSAFAHCHWVLKHGIAFAVHLLAHESQA